MSDEDRISFSHGDDFQAATPTGGLGLGPLELQYQELFAEALEDGVITVDERARLHRAAANLGLNAERLSRLEDAMTAAYETHHRTRVVDQTLELHASLAPLVGAPPLASSLPRGFGASAPPPVAAAKTAPDPELARLRAENVDLRARIRVLEEEVQRAQAAVNVEVDLSSLDLSASSSEDPEEAWRRVRNQPGDPDAHRALLHAYDAARNVDGKILTAQALVALGAANERETALAESHRPQGLIAPTASISEQMWRSCLFHPEQDAVTGAIFSVVAPAILVGRVTTLRRDGQLHHPAKESKQDTKTSTVMAVRAVGWAGALLGLPLPAVFAEPQADVGYAHVAGMPPYTVVGKKALSGAGIVELAFQIGRHMSGYRGEHFVRTLFTATEDLEDLFLAALLIANPKLPLKGAKRARIEPLARAVEPMLEPTPLDTLRGHYLRFAEEGGRTNLQRWSSAVDKTSARVGLSLCQDLSTALAVVAKEEGAIGPLALDLLSFSTGQKFQDLRKFLGVAVTQE